MGKEFASMYEKLPNLVLGFHGCDKTTYAKVLYENENLEVSENTYDWLGHGVYFWESSYLRAYDWAKRNTKYKEPSVIGAVIDLGKCLNLTDYYSTDILKRGYDILKMKCLKAKVDIPSNTKSVKKKDVLLRDLDCAVIQQIHAFHKDTGREPYDSVRGVFIEGGEAYPGSEFREKTHIQLCVVNPNCIKGVFAPREMLAGYPIP